MLREVAVAKFPDLSHVHSVTEIPHIIQAIFDISYDGILVIDKEEKIIELNQAYADFLKIRREDAIGRHVLTVIKNSKLPDGDLLTIQVFGQGHFPFTRKIFIMIIPDDKGKRFKGLS